VKPGRKKDPARFAEEVLELLEAKGSLSIQEMLEAIGLPEEKLLMVLWFLEKAGFADIRVRITKSGRDFLALPT
jgi:predicted transcriptional regulator